jgi:hypothetical protein
MLSSAVPVNALEQVMNALTRVVSIISLVLVPVAWAQENAASARQLMREALEKHLPSPQHRAILPARAQEPFVPGARPPARHGNDAAAASQARAEAIEEIVRQARALRPSAEAPAGDILSSPVAGARTEAAAAASQVRTDVAREQARATPAPDAISPPIDVVPPRP